MADTSDLEQEHTRRRPSERTVRRLLLRPAGAIRPGTVHADASSRPLLLTNSGNRLETHAALPWRSPRCVALTVTSLVPRQPVLLVRQAAAQPNLVRRVPD
jgi:hypothetical protein